MSRAQSVTISDGSPHLLGVALQKCKETGRESALQMRSSEL